MPNTKIRPDIVYKSTRRSRPSHLNTVLISPVLGEPRITQATPATSGGTNSGIMLAAAMKRLHGVLVRTTIHEKARPMTSATAVPPPQAINELASASWTFGLARTLRKLSVDSVTLR